MKYKITDCYAVDSKTVIAFQLKTQIPFQGDDTKGLEDNWISLQSWVLWVTVIPRQTSGTDLDQKNIYFDWTHIPRHDKIPSVIARSSVWLPNLPLT